MGVIEVCVLYVGTVHALVLVHCTNAHKQEMVLHDNVSGNEPESLSRLVCRDGNSNKTNGATSY